MVEQSVTISAPFARGLKYLGVSCLFMEGYTSNAVDYNLDNIRFATSILPPEVVTNLKTQVGYWGKSVTFTVTGANGGPFTYQWFHNGVPIPNAANATFTLLDIALSDAGSYCVIVANSFGTVTSGSATLRSAQPESRLTHTPA